MGCTLRDRVRELCLPRDPQSRAAQKSSQDLLEGMAWDPPEQAGGSWLSGLLCFSSLLGLSSIRMDDALMAHSGQACNW